MAVPCQVLEVLLGVPVGTNLSFNFQFISGAESPIVKYSWMVDSTVLPNIDPVVINTQGLSIGIHKVTLTVQNACGNISPLYSKRFIVYELSCVNLQTAMAINS
jgi:hypothetical protein